MYLTFCLNEFVHPSSYILAHEYNTKGKRTHYLHTFLTAAMEVNSKLLLQLIDSQETEGW